MRRVKRFLPLIAVGCVVILIFAMGWNRYLSLETLREHGQTFRDFTAANYVLSLLLLMLVRDTAVLALWAANVQPSTRTEIWLFVLGALFVIAVSPELVRRLLPTFALPQGPLRERLEALCERTGLPVAPVGHLNG